MIKENIIQETSYNFALDTIILAKKFPKNNEGYIIGRQLLKSAISIGTNVEEAIGAFSKNEFTFMMSLALKEAREIHYWMRLVRDSKIIRNGIEEYISRSEELRKILTAIVKKSKSI